MLSTESQFGKMKKLRKYIMITVAQLWMCWCHCPRCLYKVNIFVVLLLAQYKICLCSIFIIIKAWRLWPHVYGLFVFFFLHFSHYFGSSFSHCLWKGYYKNYFQFNKHWDILRHFGKPDSIVFGMTELYPIHNCCTKLSCHE